MSGTGGSGADCLVLASGNAGKYRELAALLAPLGVQLLSQAVLGIEPAEETGESFEANALLKARHGARLSGRPALADDSGLEVDALGGRPGVHSARYAGPQARDVDNNRRLLVELAGVPEDLRDARYRCVLALVRSADDPRPLLVSGTWKGRIGREPRGSGGFGYDPLFWPSGLKSTAAELSAEQKNALSHRGQALGELLRHLPDWLR